MCSTKDLLFPRSSYLAILGDDGSPFWLCKSHQHIYFDTEEFNGYWFESEGENRYVLQLDELNRIPISSIISQTKLVRSSCSVYTLSESENVKITKLAALLRDNTVTLELYDSFRRKDRFRLSDSFTVEKKKKKTKKGTKSSQKTLKSKSHNKTPKSPNWRLKINEKVKTYERDPFFEDTGEVPFISTTIQSRLLHRAVYNRDIQLLRSLIHDEKKVSDLSVSRSMANMFSPLACAVKIGFDEAIKLFLNSETYKLPRAAPPQEFIKRSSTGKYHYRSLGIREIRKVQLSRGGREGNNALTKSDNVSTHRRNDWALASLVLKWNTDEKILRMLIKSGKENMSWERLGLDLSDGIFRGCGVDSAALVVKECLWFGDYSQFHYDALTFGKHDSWKNTVRESSVRKKGPNGVTPLHLACVNPEINALTRLFQVCPELYLGDERKRSLTHYAAACVGLGPLKFLLSKGVNLEDTDINGLTPLMVACKCGNVEAVNFIVNHIKSISSLNDNPKVGPGGIDRAQKNSWCAIHWAVFEDRVEVVRALIKLGVNVNKQLHVKYQKVTPMMLAAALGYMEIVKVLVEEGNAKVEMYDKLKRTALTHACMNGSTNVASYLLHLGANPNKPDSSGNTNLHYSCAYGWYYCTVSLIEAGATIDEPNDWKLTPTAIAFLKGHIGLGRYLLEQPGINVDFRDEQGKTTLMLMIERSHRTMKEPFVEDVFAMIDSLGADPTITDYEGKNMLHYLMEKSYDITNTLIEDIDLATTERHLKVVKFFLDKKCDVWAMNHNDKLPLDILLSNLYDRTTKKKNYKIITAILNAMKLRIHQITKPFNPKTFTLLETFAYNQSLLYIKEDRAVLERIVELIFMLERRKLLDLKEYRKSHQDLIFEFCRSYCNFPVLKKSYLIPNNFEDKFFLLNPQVTFNEDGNCHKIELFWKQARELIRFVIEALRPVITYSSDKKCERNGKTMTRSVMHSTLPIMMNAVNEPLENNRKPGFELMREFDGNVDPEDEYGTTPLIRAIKERDMNKFKLYLAAGADSNHIYESNNPESYLIHLENKVLAYHVPIVDAVIVGNLEMVRLLLQHGARVPIDVQPEYPLFLMSLKMSLADRKSKEKLQIFQEIHKAGAIVDFYYDKRGPWHVCINDSSDESDTNLDIELYLAKNNLDVCQRDNYGRLPLHYAFAKFDSITTNSRQMDPIAVVSLLVDAMKGRNLNVADENGATPLHYAAFRGATASLLFLLQKGAELDKKDQFGNTAIGYAVMGKHEGATVALLLKGANVNVDIQWRNTGETSAKNEDLIHYKFLSKHFVQAEKNRIISFFQGVVENEWLGVIYLVLDQMESFSMNFSKAVEVAIMVKKLHLTKMLISKQLNVNKLRCPVTFQRNLIHVLALYSENQNSHHIMEEVFDLLKNAGNSLSSKDLFGCTPFHYAALTRNIALQKILLSHSDVKDTINDLDVNGRSPLMAAMWKSSDDFNVELLLKHGANPNISCPYKKVDLIGGTFMPSSSSLLFMNEIDLSGQEILTPLIVAIAFRNIDLIKTLLRHGADVNLTDGKKRTPLMYAVKTNNLEIIKILLSKNGDYKSDQPPPTKKAKTMAFKVTSGALLNYKDVDGFNVAHHALFIDDKMDTSFDNAVLFKFLMDIGVHYNDHDNVMKMNPLELAEYMGARQVKDLLRFQPPRGKKRSSELIQRSIASRPQHIESNIHYDVINDARQMIKKLMVKASKEDELNNIESNLIIVDADNEYEAEEDEDEDNEDDNSVDDYNDGSDNDIDDNHSNQPWSNADEKKNVSNRHIYEDYDVTMSKVDTGYGMWGMYNFYRMYILKDIRKDMYILYTNWGRWGDQGQHQETPFGFASMAVNEFKKIFREKTGNEWAERKNFENKPKKYRLLDPKLLRKVEKPKITFDLKSNVKSNLPKEIQDIIKDIANVSMYSRAYTFIGVDERVIPFGQISVSNISLAKKILKELEPHVLERERIERDEKSDSSSLCETLRNICDLSSEYYHVIPRKDLSLLSLRPIESHATWKREMSNVDYLLEFEVVERLLLGAQYRKNEINPLDYIYHALNWTLEVVPQEQDIAPHIMRYVYNSKNTSEKMQIASIVKVCSKRQQPFVTKNDGPPKMLWHGTKTENLFSILTQGLVVGPLYSERSGSQFGNGIYTSDVFDKSINYCGDESSKYVLLCKVALGKVCEVNEHNYNESFPIKGYDSTLSYGIHGPKPDQDVILKSNNCIMPLGKIQPTSRASKCWPPYFSEFIVYDSERIAIEYIVRVK